MPGLGGVPGLGQRPRRGCRLKMGSRGRRGVGTGPGHFSRALNHQALHLLSLKASQALSFWSSFRREQEQCDWKTPRKCHC